MVKLGKGKLRPTELRTRRGKAKMKDLRFGFGGKTWKNSDLDKALREKLKQMVREKGPLAVSVNLYTDTIYASDMLLIKNARDVDRISFQNDRSVDNDESAINANTRVSMASIIFAPTRVPRGGKDKHNDCLYHCLMEGFELYKLPKILKSAKKFKRWLGLNRDDLVPLDMIPRIEDKLKTNIEVVGPDTYHSPKKYPKDLKIRLYDEHYDHVYQLDEYKLLTKGYSNGTGCTGYPVMYKRDYENNTAKICDLDEVFKGDKIVEDVPSKWLSTFYEDMPLGHKFFLLEVHKMKKKKLDKKGKPLKTQKGRYVYYIPEPEDVIEDKIAEMKAFQKGAYEQLGGLSRGSLNPMHCKTNYRLLATQFFYKTAPRLISNCDEYIYNEDSMLREDYWLQQAMTGGLIWSERHTTLKKGTSMMSIHTIGVA